MPIQFRILVFAFAALLIAGCATDNHNDEAAQLHMQNGTNFLNRGLYPQALGELLQAERLAPSDPTIQNNLGLAYYVRHEYGTALEHINHALQLNPKYSDARNNRGRILVDIGRYPEAIADLKVVTRDLVYPNPEKAFMNLGLAYLKSGHYEDAHKSLEKAIESNAKFCPAHNYLGQALFQEQKFTEAIEAFENSLKICDNHYDEPHYYLALSFYKLGQHEKANARFEEVVRLYPESEYARKAKAMLKLNR